MKKPKKKKAGANVDLSRLDNESIEIMAMLMLFCIRKGLSAHDVFEGVVYDQNIKSKSGNAQVVQIMKADDFYRVLYESEIRPSDAAHENLQEFL